MYNIYTCIYTCNDNYIDTQIDMHVCMHACMYMLTSRNADVALSLSMPFLSSYLGAFALLRVQVLGFSTPHEAGTSE